VANLFDVLATGEYLELAMGGGMKTASHCSKKGLSSRKCKTFDEPPNRQVQDLSRASGSGFSIVSPRLMVGGEKVQ
jgi:hypothetical protein